MSSFKETNIGNPGTTIKFGSNDLDLHSKLLNGGTTGIPPVIIKSVNDFGFADAVLWLYNQAATKKTMIRGQSNTPATDVDLSLPPITGNDVLPALNLAQTWLQKQQFNAGVVHQETSEPATPATIQHIIYVDSVTKHLTRKNSAGQKIDYDLAVGGSAPNNSSYITMAVDPSLTQERTLGVGDGISMTDGGAGNPVTLAQDTVDLGRRRVQFVDDFFGTTSGDVNFMKAVSGTGADVTNMAVAELGVFGVWQLTTGTTATGRAAIIAGNADSFSLGQGQATFEVYLKFPTLSTVAEEFILRIGFMDSTTGGSTNGVYMIYDRLTSLNWKLNTITAGGSSTVNTSATPVGTGWTRLKIVVNAAGTSVSFFVNGTQVSGSPITTNIPVGAGKECTLAASLIKSAGINTRNANIDYVAFDYDLTTPR